MLTEQETCELRAMVTEMTDRGLESDLHSLTCLAMATGDEWARLAREYLSQWRPLITLAPNDAESWTCSRCQALTSTMLTRCSVCDTPRPSDQPSREHD